MDETDSTNSFIKLNHDKLKKDYPLAVFAESQLSGRGREDRKWYSLKNKGIYCSIGIDIKSIKNLNFLSLAVGVAISEFLTSITEVQYTIKWPNDILFKNKKIAGILIENIIIDTKISSVIGIGLNVNNDLNDFPDELKNRATSLKLITENLQNIKKIKADLIKFVFKWLNILENNEIQTILEKFHNLSKNLINKKIKFHYNGKMIDGIYKGIGENGEIILEDSNKNIMTFFSGEIS